MEKEKKHELLAWIYVYGGGNEALTFNEEFKNDTKKIYEKIDAELLKNKVSELCEDGNIFKQKPLPEWAKLLNKKYFN
jgi:hypothetical protein